MTEVNITNNETLNEQPTIPEKPEDDENEIVWEEDKPGKVDTFINRLASRKLIVWVVATTAMFMEKIDADNWVTLSIVYISTAAAVDIVNRLKNK